MIAPSVFDFCDVCDATLTAAEKAANPRWDQDLCDGCAGEFDAANVQGDPRARHQPIGEPR